MKTTKNANSENNMDDVDRIIILFIPKTDEKLLGMNAISLPPINLIRHNILRRLLATVAECCRIYLGMAFSNYYPGKYGEIA